MKKRVIITGGAGFIASHITDAYIARGHRVAVIDNLSTGKRSHLNSKAAFYKADIRDAAAMELIFRRERPDAVSHYAAMIEAVKSIRDPLPTLETNVLGTANILIAFGKYGRSGAKRKFIFASTGGAIYGEPKKIPVGERTPPAPLSPYGLSKLIGEELIKFYARSFGFSYLCLRYANVYGPRQNPRGEAGVVAIFGGLTKEGRRPTIFGNGTKVRDYVYVGDVVRANLLGFPRGKNETVNIGCGKPITDQMIFDAAAKATGFHGKPIYAPYRKGEVYKITLDARRAARVLGWRPKVKLEEGIKKTIANL